MIEFFRAIMNIFTYIADVIITSVSSIISVFRLLITVLSDLPIFIKLTTAFSADLPQYLNWLPASVVSIVTLVIGLVVVYKFFGRT